MTDYPPVADDSNLIFFVVLGIIFVVFFQWRSGFRRLRSRDGENRRFHRSRLISVLLNLDERSFEELMQLYKKEFGPGAARYARRTYKNWKTGKVRPNVETYRRFLVHLPEVMSFDLKCEALRLFMEEYSSKAKHELDVSVDDWEEKLTPLIEHLVDKAFTTQLPRELERKLRWLGEGDMLAAQEILRVSRAQESRIVVSNLREEFDNIEKLLAENHLKPRVTHMIRFPYGTITVNIRNK